MRQILGVTVSAPDNAQLRVYYAHIWILTHRLEIHASSWRTHIFKAIERVDGYLAHQRNKIGKVRNAKLCLLTYIPVRDADWFKLISVICISKLIGRKFTSFLSCHFFSMPLFSLRLKTCRFYLVYTCEEALGSKVWWKCYRWGGEKY